MQFKYCILMLNPLYDCSCTVVFDLIDVLALMGYIVVREHVVFLLSLLFSCTKESVPYKDVVNGIL